MEAHTNTKFASHGPHKPTALEVDKETRAYPVRHARGKHEIEVLMTEHDGVAESDLNWKHCEKNPGHTEFMSVHFFASNFLPKFPSEEQRNGLHARIDLTVRLRVHGTSTERSEDDELSEHRGTPWLRLGTGFVCGINGPDCNSPCPCAECGGFKQTKHWMFLVRTANHLVYNKEEARWTKVDLFFDHDAAQIDGTMKTVWGVDLDWASPCRDISRMMCVTHDEALAQRIKSAFDAWRRCKVFPENLSDMNFLPTWGKGCGPALIVSHPHGKPKKVSVGEVIRREEPIIKYNTATCRGSSGAPVFVLDPDQKKFRSLRFIIPVHCGSITEARENHDPRPGLEEDQQHVAATSVHLNFGYHRLII